MRILMLNYEYPPLGGGASPVTKSLAEELVTLGHTVDVVTMSFKGLKQREEINGVTIYRVPSIRKAMNICQTHEMLSYCLSAYRLLPTLLKENKYDLNHTHFVIPTGILSFSLRKFKGLPYVISSHGSDIPGYNPDRFFLAHKIIHPLWKKIIENSDYVICPSQSQKNLILSNVPIPDKTKVIPYGFDYSQFRPVKKEKKILLSSRLVKRKGFQYFLDAIRELEIGYEINILGDGPYKKALMQKAKEVNADINFKGWLDNSSQEYRGFFGESSIFVFPSSSESFGVVLLEAMSSRCAIITSNAAACPEVVGDTALLVRPRNSGDIKNALLQLINDDELRSKLGQMARRRVEEEFTWKSIAQQYIEIYKSVVENEAGGN